MNGLKKILIFVCCILLLAVGWIAALLSKSDATIQKELIAKAQVYLEDEIYVRAVPLLEEAAGYDAKHRATAEALLKKSYIELFETSGYSRKYENLLTAQMGRKNAGPEVFQEAAQYYLGRKKYENAFDVLKQGISRTGSQELQDLYEEKRYEYISVGETYQDVTEFTNGAIQVCQDGYWGLAGGGGQPLIRCQYDDCSSYENGEVIVRKGKLLEGVNLDRNRLALYKGAPVREISNFHNGRVALKQKEGWVIADADLNCGTNFLEEIRTYSDGGAAAKQSGKWGVLGRNGVDWLLEPAYDEILCDGLGRCWKDGAVFVRDGKQVKLLIEGKQIGEAYEDARPFADGWAAVKKNGKWGYIDREGTVKIDFQFDDARSFTMHLAPVLVDDLWGYVSLSGEMAIEPAFLDAKPFARGTAPVLTADGWQFIALLEYAS